jgi:hypothetical protein
VLEIIFDEILELYYLTRTMLLTSLFQTWSGFARCIA